MRKMIIIVFLLVFLFSGYMIISHFAEANKQEEQFNKLIQEVENASEPTNPTNPTNPTEDSTEPQMITEYAKLYEQNNDFVGWIKIEDTKINYPVMQSVKEPDFYLKHSFEKTYSDYGCPYLGKGSDLNEPSDNLIIYGHHMKNGTMFSDLEKLKQKDFWETHKTFSFDTLYEKQTYEIVSVFKTVVYTDSKDEFKYYQFVDANTPEDFTEYVSRAQAKALYETGVTAEYGDKLITLSTCEYSNKNGRLVVVAKRVAY